MTQEELNALIALLNRTPLSPAEALWLRDLLRRLEALVAKKDKAA